VVQGLRLRRDEDDAGPAACASVHGCNEPEPHGWMKLIIFDGSQVDEPLVDFPLLIRITDSLLMAAARDGSDIHFLAEDAITLLDYEIERYDAENGALVAWVRLPQRPPEARVWRPRRASARSAPSKTRFCRTHAAPRSPHNTFVCGHIQHACRSAGGVLQSSLPHAASHPPTRARL
jgi:hypothetical protein